MERQPIRQENWWIKNKRRVIEDPLQLHWDVFAVANDLVRSGLKEKDAVSFAVGKQVAGMTEEELRFVSEGVREELKDLKERSSGDALDEKVIEFTRLILMNLESINAAKKISCVRSSGLYGGQTLG